MKRLILFNLILFFLCGCDTDPIPVLPPIITTGNASNVMNTTATVSLSITDVSNSKEIGVFYVSSSAILATTDAQKGVIANLKSGNDSVSLAGLSPGTVYYYKAYATDGTVFIYGDMKTFTTGIDYATLTTNSVNSITTNSATCGGVISSSGGGSVSARGVCWSTTSNPTIANNITTDGTGTDTFTSSITGLTANTVYYVRAYATNEKGTAYGIQVNFTTLPITIPTLTTTSVSSITTSTAISGGNITDDGGAPVTTTGVCCSTTSNPIIANSKTAVRTVARTLKSSISGLISGGKYNVLTNNIPVSGGESVNARGVCWSTALIPNSVKSKTTDETGTVTFTSSLTGLSANTTYYVRAYATNSAGTGYGTQVAFTTLPILFPTITTTTVSSTTTTTATCGGNITNDGGATVTSRGVCWSTTSTPTITDSKTSDGTGTGTFTSSISGLTSNTTYYVRAYATNSAGTAYGTQVAFTTSPPVSIPTITTTSVSLITTTTAISGGNITNDGGATVTARGVCWCTTSNPTITNSTTTDGTGTGIFTSTISGLTTSTTYYIRAYATNSAGTAYGSQVSFTTSVNPANIPSALIPAGTFTMGSPTTEVGRNSDETQHQVTLSAFRMSKYDITNAQYAAFLNAKSIGSNGLYASGAYPTQALIYATFWLTYSGTQWVPAAGYENNPVIDVTWYGAVEYATYVGGTLPTEAQWEYACRAGTTTPFNTGTCLTNLQANYDWSDPYGTCTNTVTTYQGLTQPVGTYAPNAYGLYDMHGNVWQWCADWYDTYPTTAQTNPKGATTGSERVTRGGSWSLGAQYCRSACRGGYTPDFSDIGGGFRMVFVP